MKIKEAIMYIDNEYAISVKNCRIIIRDIDGIFIKSILMYNGLDYYISLIPIFKKIFRLDINKIYKYNNELIIISKKAISKISLITFKVNRIFSIKRGSRPLNICISPEGKIYWGEYFQNRRKKSINVYTSDDMGENWTIFYRFKKGEINHIHGIFYDIYERKIWITTGDVKDECKIGYLDKNDKSFKNIYSGSQMFRTCKLYFYPKIIVYATDSQYIKNKIILIDRKNYSIKLLKDIQGSVINGTQIGSISMVSTAVEASKVNICKRCYIWLTKDGINWDCIFYKKSWYISGKIFQYSTFKFPEYSSDYKDKKYFAYGRNINEFDSKSIEIYEEDNKWKIRIY